MGNKRPEPISHPNILTPHRASSYSTHETANPTHEWWNWFSSSWVKEEPVTKVE